MDPQLVALLSCPITHEPLALAPPDVLERIQHAARAGRLFARSSEPVRAVPESGLVNRSRTWFYGVFGGIPHLVPDEAVALPVASAGTKPLVQNHRRNDDE